MAEFIVLTAAGGKKTVLKADKVLGAWDATLHPRDKNGKFIKKGSLVKLSNGQTGQVVGVTKGLGGKPKLTVDTTSGTVVHPAAISVAVTKEPVYSPGDKVTVAGTVTGGDPVTGTVVGTPTNSASGTIVQVQLPESAGGGTIPVFDKNLEHAPDAPPPGDGGGGLKVGDGVVITTPSGKQVHGTITQDGTDGSYFVKTANPSDGGWMGADKLTKAPEGAPAPPDITETPATVAKPIQVGNRVTLPDGQIGKVIDIYPGLGANNETVTKVTVQNSAGKKFFPQIDQVSVVGDKATSTVPVKAGFDGTGKPLHVGDKVQITHEGQTSTGTVTGTNDYGDVLVDGVPLTNTDVSKIPDQPPDLTDVLKQHVPDDPLYGIKEGDAVTLPNGQVGEVVAAYPSGLITVATSDGGSHAVGAQTVKKVGPDALFTPAGPKLNADGTYAGTPKVGDRVIQDDMHGAVTKVYPQGQVDVAWDASPKYTLQESAFFNPVGKLKPETPDAPSAPDAPGGWAKGDKAYIKSDDPSGHTAVTVTSDVKQLMGTGPVVDVVTDDGHAIPSVPVKILTKADAPATPDLAEIKTGDMVQIPGIPGSSAVEVTAVAEVNGKKYVTVKMPAGGTVNMPINAVTKAGGDTPLTTPPKGVTTLPPIGTMVKVNYNGKVITGKITSASLDDGLAYVEGPDGGQLGWIGKADMEPIASVGPQLDYQGKYNELPKAGDRVQSKSGLSHGVVTAVNDNGTIDVKYDDGDTVTVDPIHLLKPEDPNYKAEAAPTPSIAKDAGGNDLHIGDSVKPVLMGGPTGTITKYAPDGSQVSTQISGPYPAVQIQSADDGHLQWVEANMVYKPTTDANDPTLHPADDSLLHSAGPSYTASDGKDVYEGQTIWDKLGNKYVVQQINPTSNTATATLTKNVVNPGESEGKSKTLPLDKFTEVTVTSDPKLNAPSAPSAGDEIAATDQHGTALHIGDTVQMDNGTTGKVTGDTGSSWHVEVDGTDVSADSVTRLDADPAANPTWDSKIKVKDVAGNKIANGDTVYVSSIGRKAVVVGNLPPEYESETPKLVVKDPGTGENHVVPSGNVEKVSDPNVLFGQEAENTLPRVRLTVTQVEALNDYTGSGYSAMNSELRNYEGDLVQLKADEGAHLASEVGRLDTAIKKSVIPQPVMVYRGMNHTHPGNIKKGTTFRDWGFISTTTNRNIADGFGPGVLMQLSLPPGQHALSVDNNGGGAQGGGEDEILLPRGQAFYTTNVIKLNGRTIIQAKPVDNPTGTVLASATMPVTEQPAQPEEKSLMDRYAERLIWDPEDVEIISQEEPDDAVIAAAGGRFTGDSSKFFGGDKRFPKAGHPGSWDALRTANAASGETVSHVKPDEVLFASQDHHDRRTVATYRTGGKGPHAAASVKVFHHTPTGRKHVINGHHRILADRIAGKATPVVYLAGDTLPGATAPTPAPAATAEAAPTFGIIKAIKAAWNAAVHPRDKNGRFITKGEHVTLGDGSTGQVIGAHKLKNGGTAVSVKRDNGTTAVVSAASTTVQDPTVKNPKVKNPKVPAADLMKSIKDNGGFTYDPKTGGLLVPGKDQGFAVAVPGTEQIVGNGDVSRHDFAKGIQKVMQAHSSQIAAGAKLGGWYSEDRNAYMVEVTDVLPQNDRAAAIAEGGKRNQEGIFDIGNNAYIPTGGTGDAAKHAAEANPPNAPSAPDAPAKPPKKLDTPSSNYGMTFSQDAADNTEVQRLKADDAAWANVPTTDYPLTGNHNIVATEPMLMSKPINKVVAGEPFRPGYDPRILRTDDGDIVIDGHHRVAMHTALGHDSMPAKVLDQRSTAPGAEPPDLWADPGSFTPRQQQAWDAAAGVLQKANAAEKQVTADLQSVTSGLPGHPELVSLDHRLKTQKSLARKIHDKTLDPNSGKGTIPEYAARIGDALRYTQTNDTGLLAANANATLAELQKRGYTVTSVENTWLPGSSYKGINTNLVTPDGKQTFELQFHTPESLATKDVNHNIYDVARLPQTPKYAKAKMDAQMTANAAKLPDPPGIETVRMPAPLPTPTPTPSAPLIPPGTKLDPGGLMDIAKANPITPATPGANPVGVDYRNMNPSQRIAAVAMMYGIGSKQYAQAIKKWGKQGVGGTVG